MPAAALDPDQGAGQPAVGQPAVGQPGSGQAIPAVTGPLSRRAVGWLVPAIPAAAELAIGGYRLGGPSLWRDEAYTISAATRSAGKIMSMLRNVDAVHGPYYLGMHLVVGIGGTSATAIRLPSLLGMAITVALTAVLGRRIALAAEMPAPSVTGMAAGLLLALVPETTYYAQDARPYGLVSMFAVLATYFLVRACGEDRWGWWAGYGAALALAGLSNLFVLLIVAAHGVTVLAARARARASGRPAPRLWPLPAAVAAAVIVLSPMIVFGYRQSATLGWVHPVTLKTVTGLIGSFAGSKTLIPLVAALAVVGVAAGLPVRRRPGITPATVALPWLVLPAGIMLGISVAHPIYVERYVIFCEPALALLCAAGLTTLARLARLTAAGRASPVMAWLPAAVVAVVLVLLSAGPQLSIRRDSARADNLRGVAAVITRHERPGDVVLYVPAKLRVVSIAYPAAFRRVRDVALAESPVASDSLVGTDVPPAQLVSRLSGVRRLWLLTWTDARHSAAATPGTREEALVAGRMRLIRQWIVRSVELRLYAAG